MLLNKVTNNETFAVMQTIVQMLCDYVIYAVFLEHMLFSLLLLLVFSLFISESSIQIFLCNSLPCSSQPRKIFQQCVGFIQNYISGNSAQPVNNYCVLAHEEGHNGCSRKHKLQSIFKHNLESTSLRANTSLFRSVRLSPVFAGLVHKQLLKTLLCCVS